MNRQFEMEEHVCLDAWWAAIDRLGHTPRWLVQVDVAIPDTVGYEAQFLDSIRRNIHPRWITIGVVKSLHSLRYYDVTVVGFTETQLEDRVLLKDHDFFNIPLWVLGLE